jgi:hypothetical protein
MITRDCQIRRSLSTIFLPLRVSAGSLKIETTARRWAKGVDGTEHLAQGKGRIDIELMMWANPDLGVLLIYTKWGGGHEQAFSSKGDLGRLREWVRGLHGTPLPVGLFIPFEVAWEAVKEFIETDGEIPRSIEWIANRDLPPNTFPDP